VTLDYLEVARERGARCFCNDCLAELGITVPRHQRRAHDSESGARAVVFREGRLRRLRRLPESLDLERVPA
jgi:hypothetical protein